MSTSQKPAESSRIEDLSVNKLQPNPLQPRGIITSDSIKDLKDSIDKHGILEPLVVAHTPAGYQIIVGERRWRAAKSLEMETVPCIIKETTPKGMLEMALVENVQREDLNPLERAKAFERLAEEFNLSRTETAERIGKSVAYVSNSLKLLTLPDAVKDGLLSGLISEGHARAIQGIENHELMIEAYKLILKESASVRRAEEIARRIKAAVGQDAGQHSQRGKDERYIYSEQIDKIEDGLRGALGKSVSVKLRRTRRRTRLNIVLKGSLEETEDKLQQIYRALVETKPKSEKG